MGKNISNPLKSKKSSVVKGTCKYLILHNDNINTFEHVINSLIDICEHDFVQAEQCALITHFKGKCDIKKGELYPLKQMKKTLTEKGLSVTME